ncbi:MAG: pH regulation protein F [Clostridiales bacterium]|nr:pH regulation protein F [Clostridiales bacterium]
MVIDFFSILLWFILALVLIQVFYVLTKKDVYDKLNGLFAMNTNIVILLLGIGYVEGRLDMYIDIALSYAILGFVITVILAKYIGGRKK